MSLFRFLLLGSAFVVVAVHAATLAIPLAQQITPFNDALSPAWPINPSSASSPYSSTTTPKDGKAGLRVAPGWGFSFGFLGSTFEPWPLYTFASLSNGHSLPDWIQYDPRTYTFNGIAPYPNGGSMEMEIRYSASDNLSGGGEAEDSFWLVVADHELKLRDAQVGIVRNISAEGEWEVNLLDGNDDDPFAGDVLWDAGTLPIWGVQDVQVVTSGTQYSYNEASRTLSGNLTSQSSPPSIPLMITDSQNLTLTTSLHLHPVPSFFNLPSTISMDNGIVVVPANHSTLASFNLKDFVSTEGQASMRRRVMNLTMIVEPDDVNSWFTFDTDGYTRCNGLPSDLDDLIAHSSSRGASSIMNSTATLLKQMEKRKHHRFSRLEAAIEPTSALSTPSPHTRSSSTTEALHTSSIASSPIQSTASSAIPSSINITFLAHSLESRTTSKLRMRFNFSSTPNCSSSLSTDGISCITKEDDPQTAAKHANNLAAILATVFTVLLVAIFIVALLYSSKKRGALSDLACLGVCLPCVTRNRGSLHEKVDPYVLKQDSRAPSTLGADDLERGVGGRITSMHPSMAETRNSDGTTTVASSAQNSRAPSPGSNINGRTQSTMTSPIKLHNVPASVVGNGSGTESSGSHYGSSVATKRTGVGIALVSGGESSTEDEAGGRHLAPPISSQGRTTPTSVRSVSPTPSTVTATSATSGATIPKQTFFAKVKTFAGPRHDRSSSSEDEPRPSKIVKPSIFATIKETSIGSMLGLNDVGNGSVKKVAIGKPRPLTPSLGTYLAKDHAEQVARKKAMEEKDVSEQLEDVATGVISRKDPSESGASYLGGTAVIYSMRNSPLPIDYAPSPVVTLPIASPHDPSSAITSFPVANNHTYPLPNPYSNSSIEKVTELIRQRSTRSALPQASSNDNSLMSSSQSTITASPASKTLGAAGSGTLMMADAVREIPRRRQDFHKPRRSVLPAHVINSETGHTRAMSEESTDSVAVVSTAALAVRSPMATAAVIPSLKPLVAPHAPAHPSPLSSPIQVTEGEQSRLVQFIHERQYDGGSSSDTGDDRVQGAYSTYQGKREQSQKAVMGSTSGTPPERWDEMVGVPPTPVLVTQVTGSGGRLAEKVKMMREQSRLLHEQRMMDALPAVDSIRDAQKRREASSPAAETFLDDPTLAAGIQYMQSIPSNDAVSARVLEESGTGVALGGDMDAVASVGSIAGRAKVIASPTRVRARTSQTQPSFISFDVEPLPSITERRTPPRIPLPPPPDTQYFDLSESSSGSSSSSQDTGIIRHRVGQERILVGVNEPFNFPAPLYLSGSSPGQSARRRILDSIKSSQSESNALSIRLWAEMEDGSPLPEWLGFDPLEAEFWGVPERNGSLRVKVYLQEDEGVKEVGRFIVEIVGR